jgi:glutathione synthase
MSTSSRSAAGGAPGAGGARARAVLLVLDPLEELKAHKDSSIAMMRALAARGFEIWACTPRGLHWDGEGPDAGTPAGTGAGVSARAQRLELMPPGRSGDGWYRAGAQTECPLTQFAVVLMRKDPPFDGEYLYATLLLSAAVRQGARVLNDPQALRNHNEKLAITEFPEFIAPTLVTCDPERILAFQRVQQQIVVKPLDGMGGSGVFRLDPGEPNTHVILETATQLGTRTVMAQRYLPQIAQGDKRILLIDGRPVPYALARVPKPGESRGNLAAGGTGHAQPLSDRDRQIAEALGPILASRGLFLVGLDVIGDCLTEINVTSPTCFVEIQEQVGYDVAGAFADALERQLAS